MKMKYLNPVVEIVVWECADVITTSGVQVAEAAIVPAAGDTNYTAAGDYDAFVSQN